MRIGAVTIGQSPRVDLVPEIAPLLPGVEIMERGALDALTAEQLAGLQAREGVLASRLRDGTEVLVEEAFVRPRLQEAVSRLEQAGAELVLLFCTGTFEAFRAGVPVLYPDRIFQGLVRGVFPGGSLGVLTPNAAQCGMQTARWEALLGVAVRVEAVTPYRPDNRADLAAAARRLAAAGATLIALDCLGYDRAMREIVREQAGCPVLIPRTALARAAAELLGL